LKSSAFLKCLIRLSGKPDRSGAVDSGTRFSTSVAVIALSFAAPIWQSRACRSPSTANDATPQPKRKACRENRPADVISGVVVDIPL
jgi:hypothetical protein